MSCKAVAKLTLHEREEFKEYLDTQRMSEAKSFWEVVARAMAEAFLVVAEDEIKSKPYGPLPPKWTRWA